jgi:hypothetical protein
VRSAHPAVEAFAQARHGRLSTPGGPRYGEAVAVNGQGGVAMISVLIGVLIIVVVGAICFWAIDKFATDRRLAQLLKLLVVLICLAAILQRVLPLIGMY